jgi:hypothetical protein
MESASYYTQQWDKLVLNAFTNICFRCKKKGHKAYECPEKKGRKTAPFGLGTTGKMMCNHCGKTGYKYVDCWQHEENKHKHP